MSVVCGPLPLVRPQEASESRALIHADRSVSFGFASETLHPASGGIQSDKAGDEVDEVSWELDRGTNRQELFDKCHRCVDGLFTILPSGLCLLFPVFCLLSPVLHLLSPDLLFSPSDS